MLPRQHSINSYLIPPPVLRCLPPSSSGFFLTARRLIVMFSRTYCWRRNPQTKKKGAERVLTTAVSGRKEAAALARVGSRRPGGRLRLSKCCREKPRRFSESDLGAGKRGRGRSGRGCGLRWSREHQRVRGVSLSAPLEGVEASESA